MKLPEYEIFTGKIAREFINSFHPKPSTVKIAKEIKCTPFQISAFLNSKARRPKMSEAQIRALYDILKIIGEADGVIREFQKLSGHPKGVGNKNIKDFNPKKRAV